MIQPKALVRLDSTPVESAGLAPRSQGPVRLLLALALATTFLLALTAAPALAAQQYPFLGQLPLTGPNLGLAGNGQTGDALVSDSQGGNTVVDVFSPAGSLTNTIDGSGTPAGSFGQSFQWLAANDTSGHIYATDRHTNPETVDVFDSSGAYLCQITGAGTLTTSASECDAADAGTPDGNLGDLAGLAVDQATGEFYAFDTSHAVIDVFDSSGKYLRQISGAATPAGTFGQVRTLAVNNNTGDLLVADSGVVYVFDAATGTYLTTWDGSAAANPPSAPAGSFGGNASVAADNASGDVYVGDSTNNVVDVLDSAGNYLGQITGTVPGGPAFPAVTSVAVGQPSARLYVLDLATPGVDVFADQPVTVPDATTQPATAVATTTATLNGTVNPDGIQLTDCHFDYVPDSQFQSDGYQSVTPAERAPCVPDAASIPADSADHSVSADVSGLTADTTYHFRLVPANANGANPGQDQTLTTLPVPVIDAAFASNLTPTEADLNAEINPRGSQLTDCHFEYGTDTSYGTSVDCSPDAASIPPDSADHLVSAHLTGLTANTTYHWRIIATNANGTVGAAADHTFIYDTTGQGLPDARAYEMVTPPQKNGALIDALLFGNPPSFAGDGSRLIASSVQCFADSSSCTAERTGIGTPFAFTRTPAGWTTTALAPPATSNTSQADSADAGTALFSYSTPPQGEDDFYARQPDGSFTDIGPVTPPAAGAAGPNGGTGLLVTADLSHLVYPYQGDTASPYWLFDATTGSASLYEYVGPCGDPSACETRQPLLVGVGGPNDGPGSTDLISTCSTASPGGTAMSADGRVIYFIARGGGGCFGSGANASTPVPADALYARVDNELPSAHTVPVSQRSPADCTSLACTGSPPSAVVFQSASADGSRVYFTSTQQLTDTASEDNTPGDSGSTNLRCDSTTGPNGCNLYLYDFSKPGHELTAVSAGDSSGGGPRVRGMLRTSSDGSHVYFVAQGVLTAAPNGQGQTATDRADNLYLYDAASGDTSFVTALPDSDHENWTGGIDAASANASPDGRFLVFTSRGALTPDAGDAGVQQIFRYDASSGQLTRISIGNRGFNDNGNHPANTLCTDSTDCPEAAYIASPLKSAHTVPQRSDPTMSDDGTRVFFQSPVGLTPRALNDVPTGTNPRGYTTYAQNVYEWQQAGVGGCPATQSTGCVYLISDGRDASATVPGNACPGENLSAVCLIGADATGDNVFFATADRLVPQDTDTQIDLYDARVGGGFPFTPPPQPCNGDNCKPPPSGTPVDQTPGSGTASDAGNLTPNHNQATTSKKCKKGRKGRKCRKHNRAANTTRRAGK